MFLKNMLFLIFFGLFGLPVLAGIPGSITIPDTVQTDYCGVDIGAGSGGVLLAANPTSKETDNKYTILDATADFGNSSVASIDAADPIDPGRYYGYTTVLSSNYIERLAAIPIDVATGV